MKTTIEVMKQIRDKLIKGDLLCEVVSMLDEYINKAEAQSVEPVKTTRPLTEAEVSELRSVGITGEYVRVLAFNDRPTHGH